MFPKMGPLWKRPFTEPSFTYSSGSPVKKPPLQVPLTEPPLREMPVSTAFFYIPTGVPIKNGLLIKSHPPLKVPGKEAPLYGPTTGPVWREMFRFRSHSYLSESVVKRPSTKQEVNIWSLSTKPHAFVYNIAVTTPVACSLQHDTFHLGLGRTAQLACESRRNPLQNVPSTPITTNHVTQGMDCQQ
jgi:hypothetical protein